MNGLLCTTHVFSSVAPRYKLPANPHMQLICNSFGSVNLVGDLLHNDATIETEHQLHVPLSIGCRIRTAGESNLAVDHHSFEVHSPTLGCSAILACLLGTGTKEDLSIEGEELFKT